MIYFRRYVKQRLKYLPNKDVSLLLLLFGYTVVGPIDAPGFEIWIGNLHILIEIKILNCQSLTSGIPHFLLFSVIWRQDSSFSRFDVTNFHPFGFYVIARFFRYLTSLGSAEYIATSLVSIFIFDSASPSTGVWTTVFFCDWDVR